MCSTNYGHLLTNLQLSMPKLRIGSVRTNKITEYGKRTSENEGLQQSLEDEKHRETEN